MTVDLLDEDGLLDLQPRRGRPQALRASGGGASNRDLQDWASKATPPSADAAPQAPDEADRVCHICRLRPGRRDCQGCGRPVCASDSWFMFGLCTQCASEERVKRWHAGGDVAGSNWLHDEGRP